MVSQKTENGSYRSGLGKSDALCVLVSRAKNGDRVAVERLSGLAERRLVGYFRGAVGDPHIAAELVQETLMKMLRSLKGLRKVEAFWPWLFRLHRFPHW